MPPIDKALRRERKRRKAIDSKFQNVRYPDKRSGDSLVQFEVERKTTVEGKPVRKLRKKTQ